MKFIRYAFACVLACGVLCPKYLLGDDEASLELLPRGRPFRLTFADPREIKMALSVAGDGRLYASVGNYFSILGYGANDGGWNIQFGLEGDGFFGMRQADSRFPLETADGLIGAYVEGNAGPWQYQLRLTHISAHLADGSTESAITYSREMLGLRGAYVPSDSLQLYAGVSALVHTVPEAPPWTLQAGGSLFFDGLRTSLIPFFAADFKWRTESPYAACVNLELGVALNNPPEAYRSFRLFYAYYSGADPRGQFYTQYYTSHSFGLEMQI